MTAITRFDIDNLNTAATRALAEAKPTLDEAIAKHQARARERMNGLTITELRKLLPADTKAVNKAEWVELAVKQEVGNGVHYRKLNELLREAHRDELLARQLNTLLDDSDTADERIRQLAADNSGRGMFVKLAWSLDHCFAAQAAGFIAREVLRGVVEHQGELRQIALDYLRDAVKKIIDFPSHVRANGLAGSARAEDLMHVLGASLYREAVTLYMDKDDTVPMSWIRNF